MSGLKYPLHSLLIVWGLHASTTAFGEDLRKLATTATTRSFCARAASSCTLLLTQYTSRLPFCHLRSQFYLSKKMAVLRKIKWFDRRFGKLERGRFNALLRKITWFLDSAQISAQSGAIPKFTRVQKFQYNRDNSNSSVTTRCLRDDLVSSRMRQPARPAVYVLFIHI